MKKTVLDRAFGWADKRGWDRDRSQHVEGRCGWYAGYRAAQADARRKAKKGAKKK